MLSSISGAAVMSLLSRTAAVCVVLGSVLVTTSVQANGQRFLEHLSSQVQPLWRNYRPVCRMAQPADLQLRLGPRLAWLDGQMQAGNLKDALQQVGAPVLTAVWQKPAWRRMQQLESDAVAQSERENLREYFFKLQVNTPNPTREALIEELLQTALNLNMALREGIWKTCQATGLYGMAEEQMEAAVENRWQKQSAKVASQLKQELAAFYFYSYRQIANEELQQFAQMQLDIAPWTEAMVSGIQQHFAQLRAQLLQQALAEQPMQSPSDEPFPSSRPWTPTPSQSPFQP